jgi:hypothetical protein
MFLSLGSQQYRWTIDQYMSQSISTGVWDYAIYTPGRAEPDMYGKLRCQRRKLYEIGLTTGHYTGPKHQDLGDAY